MKLVDLNGRAFRFVSISSSSLLIQDISRGEDGRHDDLFVIGVEPEESATGYTYLTVKELVAKELK